MNWVIFFVESSLTNWDVEREDGLVKVGHGAVPPAVSELEATLLHGLLGAQSYGDDGIGFVATDGPLSLHQTRDAVADHVGSERNHRRKSPVERWTTVNCLLALRIYQLFKKEYDEQSPPKKKQTKKTKKQQQQHKNNRTFSINRGAVVAQWIRPRTINHEVPGSNLLAAAVVPLGKALYPHCLVPRKGLKAVGLLVACL